MSSGSSEFFDAPDIENNSGPDLTPEEEALKHALLSKVQQFGLGQNQQLEAEVEELVRRLIK